MTNPTLPLSWQRKREYAAAEAAYWQRYLLAQERINAVFEGAGMPTQEQADAARAQAAVEIKAAQVERDAAFKELKRKWSKLEDV